MGTVGEGAWGLWGRGLGTVGDCEGGGMGTVGEGPGGCGGL